MNQHVTMPSEVQEFYNAINQYQPEAFIELFTPGASVKDNGKEIAGREAIQAWGESELFSAKVRYTIMEIEESGESVAVTAEMEGNLTRTAFPLRSCSDTSSRCRAVKSAYLTSRLSSDTDFINNVKGPQSRGSFLSFDTEHFVYRAYGAKLS